jgi:peroxiredoxin
MPPPPESNPLAAGGPSGEILKNRTRPKTRPAILVAGAIVAVLVVWLWRPIQQRSLVFFLLHAEAPSEEALSSAVEQADDPVLFIKRLWGTEHMPQRSFAIKYIGRVATPNSAAFQALEPMLIEATQDVDIETRQQAFAVLQQVKHPQLRRLAMEQLSDADPAARLIGLQALRSAATTNDVSLGITSLSDPEPRVVVAAGQLLRAATGLDFGLKSSLAMPQFTFVGTNPPPQPDVAAIQHGVDRWKEWWQDHKSGYPAFTAPSLPHPAPLRLATKDFELADGPGKSVRLSDCRGKMVLLAFWSSDMPESLDESTLTRLQSHDPNHFAVVGICIPPAPSCADEDGHSHGGQEHAHHHHSDAPVASTPQQMSAAAEAKSRSAKFVMLTDSRGTLGLRFNVDDRPTYVLVDSEGMIRRRFSGFRSERALQAMVEELRTPASAFTSAASR